MNKADLIQMRESITHDVWRFVLSDNATPHIMHDNGYDWTDCGDRTSLICAMPAEITQNYNSFGNAKAIAALPDILDHAIEQAEEIERLTKERDELAASNARLREALTEAVMLMQDVRSGDYFPDTLTVQPWVASMKEPPPKLSHTLKHGH